MILLCLILFLTASIIFKKEYLFFSEQLRRELILIIGESL